MTTYFIDSDSGNNGNAGTSTGAAWADLKKAIEDTVLSPGDIIILRRGTSAVYSRSDAVESQDEDGTLLNPIIVEADYDNNFSDDVDISATATATFTFGSKTVTFSASVAGVIAVGDWIYEVNDDQREFAYEVKTVSTTTVTLYLPYKGDNAGSGKTVTNMGSAPVWGTTSYTTGYLFTGQFCRYQGIEVRSNDNAFALLTKSENDIIDCISKGGASSTNDGLNISVNSLARKCRMDSVQEAVSANDNTIVSDCLLNSNATGGEALGAIPMGGAIIDCENDTGEYVTLAPFPGTNLRNSNLSGTTSDFSASSATGMFGFEDYNNTAGDSRFKNALLKGGTLDDTFIYESDTTTVRTGGSDISIKVTPTTSMNPDFELAFLKVLEVPIFTDTTSRTYTVYFKSNATANWTANPTASELFIELEAWGHATNPSRKITKSTGTVNFTGSTAWQSLSVTVAAAKEDNAARLRVKYGKTKESTKSNEFFVDPLVVIS